MTPMFVSDRTNVVSANPANPSGAGFASLGADWA